MRQTGSLNEAERQRQSAKLFVQEILALNVLDPAMGSGHFLVEATNFLARALATDEYATASLAPSPSQGEGWGGGSRSGRPLAVPATSHVQGESGTVGTPATANAEETDLLYWKRRVVEACIYGVDKNPMAVELAKLSLWLKTAASDKPLSFLDHHLQHGDSLIGAWLDDLNKPPISAQKSQVSSEQAALFDDSAFTRDINRAVADIMTIERLPTLDIDDVHAKETTWKQIRDTHVARWRRLADLWVSAYFGNAMTPEEYRALAAYLQATHFPGNSEFPGKSEPGSSLLTEAQLNHFLQHPAVTDNDYFHWELAFPEVFFDEYGRSRHEAAGFDAVIGNPPWGAHLDQEARNFTSIRFASVHQRTPDTAKYFIGHSISSLRISGLLGFIVPNNLLFEHEYEKIRNLLLTACRINHVVNLGDSVFKEVTAPSCIIILQNEEDLDYEFRFQDLRETAKHDNFEISQMDYFVVAANDVKGLPGVSFPSNPGALSILKKLNTYCDSLEQATKDIARGIDTGANHVFVLSEEKALELNIEGRVLHPILLGGDINSHFLPEKLAQQIIYTTKNSEPDEILNTMAYLSLHKKRLSQKREAKKGLIPWYSLHWPRYPELFVSPKIVIRQTADTLIAAVDTKEYYVLNNALVILPKGESDLGSYFLSALLNSKLLRFIYQTLVQEEGRTFAEVKPVNLRRLPVPKINFGKIETKASLAVNDAQILYEQGNTTALLAWATAELAANRNDTIHDLLAHLAEQMIALNQQKQAALEAFWLDLEGVTDAKQFDTLRNKGKHQASLHKNVPATRPFVDESSRSTITLDATLGWNEDAFKGMVKELVGTISGLSKLVQVYREHAPSVTALNQRLTTTDHLIDQIVYKLYNLTPSEIAIVEGQS